MVISDHRASHSIFIEHRSNKWRKNHLSRWVDHLLPFQIETKHLRGAKVGLVDYISRNPYYSARIISNYEEEFLVVTLSKIQLDAKLLTNRKTCSAVYLNKHFLYTIPDTHITTTNQSNTASDIFNIDYAPPVYSTQKFHLNR